MPLNKHTATFLDGSTIKRESRTKRYTHAWRVRFKLDIEKMPEHLRHMQLKDVEYTGWSQSLINAEKRMVTYANGCAKPWVYDYKFEITDSVEIR